MELILLVINAVQRRLTILEEVVNAPNAVQWEPLQEALSVLKHTSILNSQEEMVIFPALARYYREAQRDDDPSGMALVINPMRIEGMSMMLQTYSHDIAALRKIGKQVIAEASVSQRATQQGTAALPGASSSGTVASGTSIAAGGSSAQGSKSNVAATPVQFGLQLAPAHRMLGEIRSYISLQRAHLTKIEQQIFPLIEQYIPRDAQQRLIRTILDISPFMFVEQTVAWAIRNQSAPASVVSDEERTTVRLMRQQRILAILKSCLPLPLYESIAVAVRREVPASLWKDISDEGDEGLVRSPSSMLGDLTPDFGSDDGSRAESTDDIPTAAAAAAAAAAAVASVLEPAESALSASSSPTGPTSPLANASAAAADDASRPKSGEAESSSKRNSNDREDSGKDKKDDSTTSASTSTTASAAAASTAATGSGSAQAPASASAGASNPLSSSKGKDDKKDKVESTSSDPPSTSSKTSSSKSKDDKKQSTEGSSASSNSDSSTSTKSSRRKRDKPKGTFPPSSSSFLASFLASSSRLLTRVLFDSLDG